MQELIINDRRRFLDTPAGEGISAELQNHLWRKEKVAEMVKNVVTLKDFKTILAACKPALRKGVYDLLAPQLEFTVPPFWAMKFRG